MPGYPVPGAAAWHDEETEVARAIGPTDVHVVNHHGSLEEENPVWLATLRSRVMIVPAWVADPSLTRCPEANAVAPHLSRAARYLRDAIPRCHEGGDRGARHPGCLRSWARKRERLTLLAPAGFYS